MRHLRTSRWARNPRRAYDRDGTEIEPVRIGDMVRRDGIRHVTACCRAIGCGHEGRVCVADWPPEMYVPDIGLRLRCSRCGTRLAPAIFPDWTERDTEIAKRRAGGTPAVSGDT